MNDAPNIKLLIDAREAARMLAISERTLWSWSAPRGSVPVVRLPGSRSVRYSVAALERWIKQQQMIGIQKRRAAFYCRFPLQCAD